MFKLHWIKKVPVKSDCMESSELDFIVLGYLTMLNISEAWYWYAHRDYEGTGSILMRKGSKYDLFDMGHDSGCSPLEDIGDLNLKSLEDLEASCSEGYLKEVKVLFDAAEGINK